jgi:hypothetical protein
MKEEMKTGEAEFKAAVGAVREKAEAKMNAWLEEMKAGSNSGGNRGCSGASGSP